MQLRSVFSRKILFRAIRSYGESSFTTLIIVGHIIEVSIIFIKTFHLQVPDILENINVLNFNKPYFIVVCRKVPLRHWQLELILVFFYCD